MTESATDIPLKEHFENRIQSLETHIKELMAQRDKRLEDVATATDRAVNAALSAAKDAVNAALSSANKASDLLAENTKDKMESQNGLLDKMRHYEAIFAPITALDDVKKALADLKLIVEKREAFWPAIGALITGLVALALGLMQLIS